MKWCPFCQRNVRPRKGWSWIGFIFTGFIPYLIYYLIKAPSCPICNAKLGRVKHD